MTNLRTEEIMMKEDRGKLLLSVPRDKLILYHVSRAIIILLTVSFIIYIQFKIDFLEKSIGTSDEIYVILLLFVVCPVLIIASVINLFDIKLISDLEIYDKGLIIPTRKLKDYGKMIFIKYDEIVEYSFHPPEEKKKDLKIETLENKIYWINNFFIRNPKVEKILVAGIDNSKAILNKKKESVDITVFEQEFLNRLKKQYGIDENYSNKLMYQLILIVYLPYFLLISIYFYFFIQTNDMSIIIYIFGQLIVFSLVLYLFGSDIYKYKT